MKKIAAFFDIDGTIYREGLITELFKKLITYELADSKAWHDDVRPAFMKWEHRQGDYDDYLHKMVEVFKQSILGISEEHIRHIARKVIEQKGDRVYTFTRDEIKRHKEANHLVIAISGSPLELVELMAKKYGFDDYRGTVYEVDEKGCYTGKIKPMWDHVSKQQAIQELVEEYDIDLNESFAYGDTVGDVTMMKMVGHPYAMNPTAELIRRLREDEEIMEKLSLIVERKDMVYHLNLKDNTWE